MSLLKSENADLLLITQEAMVKQGAFVDMQTDLTDHVAMRELWKNRRKPFTGGDDWDFFVQMDHNGSAKFTALFESDSSMLNDTMVKGTIPVRFLNAHYLVDLKEKAFNKGTHALVELVKTRYVGMMVSAWGKLEVALWSKPTDSTDEKTPWGIQYWITRNSTEGFTGANPSGFTAGKAGISASTYSRWKNWSYQYTDVTKEDLVRAMRKASVKTNFRSVVDHSQPMMGKGGNGLYTNWNVLGYMEEVLEDQNMSLGNDLASKDGRTLFKGSPVVYVPQLENDSTNPVYMIDSNFMAIGVVEGWENELDGPNRVPDKHTVRRTDLDMGLNLGCTDVRRQAVFYV